MVIDVCGDGKITLKIFAKGKKTYFRLVEIG
jgi:hypothetical protein